ncbi:MAG: ion transporter [Ruminococcus sp.]|nr:ion transporter [Ruminococcus sp.]
MKDEDRSAYRRRKKRIHDVIQIGNRGDLPSRSFDYFIVTVIILNIAATFLSTFDELSAYYWLFSLIDAVTIGIFCVEYSLRIWTADILYPDSGPVKSRLRFLFSFDGIVDLLTILPFFFLSGFIVFRMLRVVRILRLFKINAQYDSFNVIKTVLVEKRNQIVSSVFIIIVLMLASSLGMYSVEHPAQPEAFSNAFSGIWWSVSTLLTVGYGDIYPITVLGKIMAIVIAFLGVGVVAIPTGIISAGFVEQYTKKQHSADKLTDITEVGEVLVEPGSSLSGRTIAELEEELEIRILMILRGELPVIPLSTIEVEENDILILKSERLVKSGK